MSDAIAPSFQTSEGLQDDVSYYLSYFKDKEAIQSILSEKSEELSKKKQELEKLELEVKKFQLISQNLQGCKSE